MSFGWSAGDIVSAAKFLYKVGAALRESGGASTEFQDSVSFLETLARTLEHLSALQTTVPVLDLRLATDLREQCEHIRIPLAAFLKNVAQKFESTLGTSNKNKVLTAPRKIQWAISTRKHVKRLQERIATPMAAVGLLIGYQIVQTTIQMPVDTQDRISQSIDAVAETKMLPPLLSLERKLDKLVVTQATSTDVIIQRINEVVKGSTIQNTTRLETTLQTNLVAQQAQSSSLYRKLEQLDLSLGTIKDHLQDISMSQLQSSTELEASKVRISVQNFLTSIWALLSNLHLLIRELVLLLAPYLFIFYRSSVHYLLEYGDKFLFEDALGRMKRLPCAQFQFWDTFYEFLVDHFQDTPGLAFVMSQRFMVMNGFNNTQITQQAWKAVIQPKSKVVMAMMLSGTTSYEGRCADASCFGRSKPTATAGVQVCSICGKYLSVYNPRQRAERNKSTRISIPNFGPRRHIPVSRREGTDEPILETESEIAAFKRVALINVKWRDPVSRHGTISLPCEFLNIFGRRVAFTSDQFEHWVRHSLSHFGSHPPLPRSVCIFCNEESRVTHIQGNNHDIWRQRMKHIYDYLCKGV